MSVTEQENLFSILKLLAKKKGAWAFVSVLMAAPIIIGSLVAVVSYNFALVSYVNKINYAAQNAPILAAAVKAQNVNIAAVRYAVTTIHDTLNHDGYLFASIPELIPIPDVDAKQ